MAEATEAEANQDPERPEPGQRGKTVHGSAANAGHRVLAPDDAEVEAYLETALKAPAPDRSPDDRPSGAGDQPPGQTVVVLDFGSQFAQLIARRVRELDVYSELLPHDTPYEELERRGAARDHPVGRPELASTTRARRGRIRPIWIGRIPVLGICYGAHLMAHELGRRRPPGRSEPRVRAGERDDHQRRRPVRRHRARAAGLDEPRRFDHAAARGLPGDGPDRLDAVRRPRRSQPQPLRHPVPPGGRPHAARPRRPAQLRGRHRRRRAHLDRRPTSSTRRSPRSANGWTRTPGRPARTGWSSAPCRAASTRPSRRRWSTARWAIG